MSGAQGEAAVEQTDVGSYFIANYLPFSTWRPEAVAAEMLSVSWIRSTPPVCSSR
jgi:hypothetical protein